ncbi:MAG: GHKL domain-containing protein [Butyrivibrio sp.]|nr:GHKL domain-containing protein [Butyrivibrio sp.]
MTDFTSFLDSQRAIAYFLEIFIAEFLFMHSFKKRSHFVVRLIALLVVVIPLMTTVNLYQNTSTPSRLLHLIIVISASILGMLFLYDYSPLSIASSCIAGVATQHIANKTLTLIILIPSLHSIILHSYITYILADIIVSAIVYAITYYLVARNYSPQKSSMRLNVISFVIIITCIGVNRLVVDYETGDVHSTIASCIYAIICCVLALAIQLYLYKWQQQQTEGQVIKELLTASEKQYEQWKAMVEFISIQTHDLKHMIDRIQRLAEKENVSIPDLEPIRESISGFSPLVKTGNDVLDVLLRNMSTLCLRQNIRFNCVSYTDCLGLYDSMSLYFLFANAIDNARSAADKVTDPGKRLIDVSLKQFGDSVIIHIWNYYEGKIEFENDLPVRAVDDNGNGYGIKSIKMLVDKFEGAINTKTENDIFHLNIILPLKH